MPAGRIATIAGAISGAPHKSETSMLAVNMMQKMGALRSKGGPLTHDEMEKGSLKASKAMRGADPKVFEKMVDDLEKDRRKAYITSGMMPGQAMKITGTEKQEMMNLFKDVRAAGADKGLKPIDPFMKQLPASRLEHMGLQLGGGTGVRPVQLLTQIAANTRGMLEKAGITNNNPSKFKMSQNPHANQY